METETADIEDFLAACPPFDLLPPDTVAALADKIETVRAGKGAVILEPGQESRHLYLVRSGTVEIRSPTDHLLAQLGERDAFGVRALLGNGTASYRATALEDGLLCLLPQSEFSRLKAAFPHFDRFFQPMGAGGPRGLPPDGDRDTGEQLGLLSQRLRDLMTVGPITIGRDQTARDAALKMRQFGISCLPVVEGGQLVGILTNGDLRDRVVAEGGDVDAAVGSVMTPDPVALDADQSAFDALLGMTERNISHLPIVDDGKLVGIITNTNLVRKQTASAVYMVGDIYKRRTFEDLADIVAQVPRLLVQLVEGGATAQNVGHIVTSVCDAVTNRLLQLGEDRFGPAPVPYLWLACGSQGRREQSGISDQDNCMILDDAFVEAEHGAYFAQLATYVCDGLNACGYVYCPGEMMAMTPKWRQPLRQWQEYFRSWIDQPGPMAQMLASVMFDLRPIRGNARLYDGLQDETLQRSRSNSIFIAHLVSNALTHTPPLGFFRGFVLVRSGEHKNQFDMKHNGVVPIVDIARVYALQAGLKDVNTYDRLAACREGSALSEAGARDLLDAFEFISITRLKHQVRQIRSGKAPNNFMAPDELSEFERNHLRDAFLVVKTQQSALSNAHQIGAR